jgi:hypothetical protein
MFAVQEFAKGDGCILQSFVDFALPTSSSVQF